MQMTIERDTKTENGNELAGFNFKTEHEGKKFQSGWIWIAKMIADIDPHGLAMSHLNRVALDRINAAIRQYESNTPSKQEESKQ